MKLASVGSIQTFGAFIDEHYAPRVPDQVDEDAAARLKSDFAEWVSEPLAALSAWRIESWRRGQLESLAKPHEITRQLQALDDCLNKAVEWQFILRNPMQEVSLLTEAECLIELFAGGLGHGCLRDGWSPVGINWTWTLGRRAVLELRPFSGESDYVLKMHIAGVYRGFPQRLSVAVNDITVGIILCRGAASYEFFVPGHALGARERVEVVIEIPDALRPMDIEESTDDRYLGFRVAKINLLPMIKSSQREQRLRAHSDDHPGVLEQRAAVQEMTSLGFNCEFGFVQRHLGAEPMSLFRWASVPIDKLIAGLEMRFAGLTARDALDVQVNADGEFVAEDRVYGFRHHTFVFAFSGGVLERVQRDEYIRVGVLCKTLLEDLREHKKLFVYHDAGESALECIRRLVAALRSYGDNTVLWIVNAPSAAQVGETHQIEPGLIKGYVSGFQTGVVKSGSPHLPSWIRVAYGAHQIWSKAKEAREQFRLKKNLANTREQ